MTILPHFSLAQWRGNSAKPPTPSRTLGRSLVTHSLVNDALLIEGNLEVSLTTPPMVEAIPATVEAVLTEVTTLSPPCVDNDTTSQRSNSPMCWTSSLQVNCPNNRRRTSTTFCQLGRRS
ncbi:hypothetical protein TNCT_394061 [Trichonephila clavata]|uniref:Uncharacterized protein n=1 Tax=Trichonephila clavata TaxID=2740835 RepID=A0A8X6HR30_TRICU|nr:hypothetical protein TNCT_394061 [Trichonephila clavata]